MNNDTGSHTHPASRPGSDAVRSILRLRLIELAAFTAIILIAKQIADFRYNSLWFLALFAVAAALHVAGHSLWQASGNQTDGVSRRTNLSLLHYSSAVDFLTVFGVVYLTGTIESPFLFLLVVPLFFVSHLFLWRVTVGFYLTGALGAIALLGYLELNQIIPHFNCYFFSHNIHLNGHYYVGSLLVLGGFLSLILFLSNAFQDHFQDSLKALLRKDEEAKNKIQELSRLYDISLGINAVITVETLLKMVAKEATLLLSQPWSNVILFNDEGEITHSVIVGLPANFQLGLGSHIPNGGLTEWMWKHGEPVIVDDVLKDQRASSGEFLAATNIRSLIGLPLSNGHHVIGVIYVGDFVKKTFQERHLRLLTIMSDQLAIAIAKSKLYESLQLKIKNYERKIENLEKANHLKSEFVSHVSHELKTPLTSIKAYTETLAQHLDDPDFSERKEFLGIVSNESERLIRIVNDILDVSNIEFGQKTLQRSSFGVAELAEHVASMLHPKLSEKNMRVDLDGVPRTLPKVDADRDLMTQVFVNLIGNAIKYSPEGTTIRLSAYEDPVDVRVSIEDEGIGIPEEQVEKIFDKYYRVKSQASKHYDGVGLGLAIVKNIVEQHGGSIEVTSEEQKGTKFTFSIPKEHCVNDLIGFISEGVSSKTELHEMLTLVVRMIAELLSAKIISLMLLDESRRELFIKVSYGLEEWIVDQARVRVGEGIAGRVAETGMPLLIDDIEQNEVHISPNNPQYETMSLLSIPLRVNSVVVGVINVNNKKDGRPFDQDDMNLLMSFGERISKALERLHTAEDTHVYLQDTVDAFKKMLDKQIRTQSIEQLVNFALRVSRKLGLNEKEVRVIQYVASVHDIGMTKVSDDILQKTLNLSQEEVREIQKHPQRGADLIRPLEFVELVSNIILHHHERVDGRGYPMGLKGKQIPIGSRILAVIDAYQSMTTDKPYRKQKLPGEVVKELAECSGKQFDPDVVKAFIEILEEMGTLKRVKAPEPRPTVTQ